MTDSAASAAVSTMKGLMPVSPEQGELLTRKFLPYEVAIVLKVIEQHACRCKSWSISDLLGEIQFQHSRRTSDPVALHDRRESQRMVAYWKWVQRTFNERAPKMTPGELERWKLQAIAENGSKGESKRKTMDPYKTRSLQAQIVELWSKFKEPQ